MASILETLMRATKLKPTRGEDRQEFLGRIVRFTANELPESVWAKLSDETQKWCNDAVISLRNETPIVDPDDDDEELDVEEPEDEESEDDTDEEPEDDDEEEESEDDDEEEESEDEEESVPVRSPKKAPAKKATKKAAAKAPAKKATKKAAAKAPAKKAATKAPAKKAGGLSMLAAAEKVLSKTKHSLNAQELVTKMADRGYWTSPGGKTPHATLSSAILREIANKGADSRFVRSGPGKFAHS